MTWRLTLQIALLVVSTASVACGIRHHDEANTLERLADAGIERLPPAYQACDGDPAQCELPNGNCARYTDDRRNAFCAPYCEGAQDCPRIPGYDAACNFAWCAVLCDDGACPDGMVCVHDSAFIDSTGAKQGRKDVCVTAP